MLLTPSGIVIQRRLSQLQNALLPMEVTPSGITTASLSPSGLYCISIPFSTTSAIYATSVLIGDIVISLYDSGINYSQPLSVLIIHSIHILIRISLPPNDYLILPVIRTLSIALYEFGKVRMTIPGVMHLSPVPLLWRSFCRTLRLPSCRAYSQGCCTVFQFSAWSPAGTGFGFRASYGARLPVVYLPED